MNEEHELNSRLDDLKEVVARFPAEPGVYVMKDVSGEVIYVGKAKNLRARVRSYFSGGDGRYQIEFLMARVFSIDVTLTESDDQAYIFERQLINKYKPRYNIRLKDDKSYLSIRLNPDEPWPRLQLVRRVVDDGAKYFGPYRFAHEARSLLDVVNKTIPIRSCSDTVFLNRQRPCLEYQIKRCAGPCCLEIDRDEYGEWVQQAIRVLEGDVKPLSQELEAKMEQAAEDLRFEDAAIYRDRIELLNNMAEGQQLVSGDTEHRDIVAFYRVERLAAICILLVRYGRIADSELFTFDAVEVSDQELLESVLDQYYRQGREIPDEIVMPTGLESSSFLPDLLKKKKGKKVPLIVPRQGLKYRLLKLGEVNAKQQYISTFDSELRHIEIARTLSRILELDQVPRRIECLDISNFQGSDIVGAIVCFFDGEPDKSAYRKFKISAQGKPDDFGAVREVVLRRLERGFREDTLPDLLIIDGGQGQLSAALSARDELGIALDIVALAKMRSIRGTETKKPERFFLENSSEPVLLDPDHDVTKFVARVRDEVHRFVITFHRSKRHHRVLSSVLDHIPGIGPERRRRLLKTFGSVENIKKHSVEELARAGRMPRPLAEKLLRILKEEASASVVSK